MLAANEAASQINVGDIEASIQEKLQARIEAGASKNDLLAAESEEIAPIVAV